MKRTNVWISVIWWRELKTNLELRQKSRLLVRPTWNLMVTMATSKMMDRQLISQNYRREWWNSHWKFQLLRVSRLSKTLRENHLRPPCTSESSDNENQKSYVSQNTKPIGRVTETLHFGLWRFTCANRRNVFALFACRIFLWTNISHILKT